MPTAAITFDHLGTDAEMNALRGVVEQHGIVATFFVTGEQAAARPDAVRALIDAGHEVGAHGWAHEQWSELDESTERALLARTREALPDARGFRAPGGARTPRTHVLLAEFDFAYDASLGDRMQPGRLDNGTPNVPFVWPGVDGYWYLRDEPAAPADVRDAWLASVAKTDLFVTICHPEITGAHADRVAALADVVAAVAARCACETVGAIAARVSV